MTTLAVYNIKGGVGKTSTAVNLAYLAAQRGQRTLLWDLDPQAAATFIFRVRPRVKGGGKRVVRATRPIETALKATDFPGLDLLPADFTYRHMDLLLDQAKHPAQRLQRVLEPLRDEYDLVVPVPEVAAPAIAGAESARALTSAVAAATRRARCFRRPPILPSCVFIFPSPSFLRASCAVPQ